MADRYLLETSSTDGYLLENGSGVLLVENSASTILTVDADSSDGTWTDQDAGTSLFAAIDEFVANDADYIRSSGNPANDTCKIALANPTITPAQPFLVKYRYRQYGGIVGGGQIDLTVRLLEGTTEIVAFTHTGIADEFVDAEQTLSSGQFSSITDFNNLFLEFKANKP